MFVMYEITQLRHHNVVKAARKVSDVSVYA